MTTTTKSSTRRDPDTRIGQILEAKRLSDYEASIGVQGLHLEAGDRLVQALPEHDVSMQVIQASYGRGLTVCKVRLLPHLRPWYERWWYALVGWPRRPMPLRDEYVFWHSSADD